MLDKQIIFDLANETGRHWDALPPDFPQKMAKRIRRKFKLKLDVETIARLADHNQSIYAFAAVALKDCLLPAKGPYASPADVDNQKYMELIQKQFPNDDKDILDLLAGWAVYYEYLR